MPRGRYDGRNAEFQKNATSYLFQISNSFKGLLLTLVYLRVKIAYTFLSTCMSLKVQLTLCLLLSYMEDWKFRPKPSILRKTVESASHAGHFSP